MTKTHTLAARFDRAKADDAAMTVPAVLSTETPVQRGNYSEILRHTANSIDLSRFPLPLIESHDGSKLNIGIVENPVISGGKLRATVRFGTTSRAAEVFADVKAGVVRNLSIGYEWLDYVDQGEKTIVTKFKPFEVSIVSIPADPNAGFFRGKPMNEENLTGDELTEPEEIAQPTRAEKRAMKLERDRCSFINETGVKYGIDPEDIADYITRGASVADFQSHIRAVCEARLKPIPAVPRMEAIEEFGGHGQDNVKAAMIDGLLMRNHIAVNNPHPAARDFANSSIHDVARILLRQRGDRVQYASPATLIQRALATTSLTELLADVGGKALISGFEEMQQTHDKWCKFKSVKDFKTQRRIALEAIETLAAVAEFDPVTYSGLTDAQETYTIASYQKAISYSRQALINDDLGGLTELPYMLGKAARRTECNLVYSVLSTNANMGDGTALFAAGRGNYLTGATSPLSDTSLALAVAKIRKAKDIGANGFLGLRPKWLIVSPELEITALKLLATMVNVQSSSTAIPNSDFARIEVIVEPRITTATHWYLIADNIDTVEVGRLEWLGGAEWGGTADGVSFETDKDFSTDSYSLKVRLDAGAKAISPLGMVFSDGVTGG